MYLAHFGLQQDPFNLISDPRFMYFSPGHCEAMAHLLYGVRERKGVILLLGEAGTGKTTLVRTTLEALHSTQVAPAVIYNPVMDTAEELLDAILTSFGVLGYRKSGPEMFRVATNFLEKQAMRNRIPVIVIDEAQLLSQKVLEQLRLLSNLDYNGHKLVQLILSGQPELAERLDSPELRALKQRVTVRCRLRELNREELDRYIAFRIVRAGGTEALFTREAVDVIYEYSGGIPRLVNMIGDNALLAGFAKQQRPVKASTVLEVAAHLELSPVGPHHANVSLQEDIIRASTHWHEVLEDIRSGEMPGPIREYIERLRAPSPEPKVAIFQTAAGNGE